MTFADPVISYNNPAETTAAWTSSTGANTTARVSLPVGSGVLSSVVVTLNQGSTITGGVVTFEASDTTAFTNAYPVECRQENANTTANTYTLQQSTNTSFSCAVGSWQAFQVRLSTTISGTGTVNVGVQPTSAPREPYVIAQQASGSNLHTNVDSLPALPTGTNVIGHVITDSGSVTNATLQASAGTDIGKLDANQSVNVAQFGGTNMVTGTGASGSGIPRVTVSNDSTVGLNSGSNTIGKVDILGNAGVALDVAQNTAAPANALGVGGVYNNNTGTTSALISGNQSAIQLDNHGLTLTDTASINGSAVVTAATGVQKVGVVGGTGTSVETTAGVLDYNLKNVNNSAVSTAASGVQKVGIVGGTGTSFETTAGVLDANVKNIGNSAIATAAAGVQKIGISDSSGSAITIGQQTMANSVPVTLASNQTNVNVAVASALPTGTNTIGAVNQGNAGTNAQAWWTQLGDTLNGPAAVRASQPSMSDAGLVVRDPALIALLNLIAQTGNPKTSVSLRGSFGQPITSSGGAIDVNLKSQTALPPDPCAGAKTFISINQTANAQLTTGYAGKIYICSLNIVSATAQNIALVEGTGSTCGTGTAGVGGFGGATAATGYNFAANGGIAYGNGSSSIGAEVTAGDSLCLLQSGTGQVSGGMSYAVR
jgi:hypothetical protein